MDIRIFALVAFIAVLGTFTEARSTGYAHGGLRVHRPSTGYATMKSRLKREIDGYGPNYAWTGTNNGPGYASAGASAGSFGYPGMGYPMGTFPTVGSPTAFPTFPTAFPTYPTYPTYPTFPTFPTGSPMGSPSFDSRGGFPDTSPNQDNSPKKENSPNQIGYNFGGDPFSGPGFFPGQFPGFPSNFNDPTFDMIKQIQAQIEAQHRANMAAGSYGSGQPQVASASIGLGPYGGFQSGQISPASPGIESRFAEDLPAPSGNSFGIFASSSSSSQTDPDGNQINRKSSITGVNDNGKISYRTVYD